MDRKKNILIIIPKLSEGGAERVTSNLSRILEKHYKIFFLIFNSNKIDYPVSGELIDIDSMPSDSPFIKLVNIFLRAEKIKKIKKEKNIDITISAMESANIASIMSKQKDKTLITIHNFMSIELKNLGFYGYFQKLFIKYLYNRADAIVPVSKSIGKNLIDNFNINSSRVHAVYNCFNISKIRDDAQEKLDKYSCIYNDGKVIINTGRFTKQKAQWHLIRSFKEVKKTLDNAKLVFLGDGELRNSLLSLAKELELKVYSVWDNEEIDGDKDVYFLGFQANPYKFISRSDLFALSSLWEGLPSVIIEALACGTPVISTDCRSGPREILSPETDFNLQTYKPEYAQYGILMPVFDGKQYIAEDVLTPEESLWAEILVKTLSNNNLTEKYKELSGSMADKFDEENILREWKKLF